MSETIAEIAAKVRPLLEETADSATRERDVARAEAEHLRRALEGICNETSVSFYGLDARDAERLQEHIQRELDMIDAAGSLAHLEQLQQLRKERDEADVKRTQHIYEAWHEGQKARRALSDAGHCRDGDLAAMITRALKEAEAKGRDHETVCAGELVMASAEFPDEWTGTVAERAQRMRREWARFKDRANYLYKERAAIADRYESELGVTAGLRKRLDDIAQLADIEPF